WSPPAPPSAWWSWRARPARRRPRARPRASSRPPSTTCPTVLFSSCRSGPRRAVLHGPGALRPGVAGREEWRQLLIAGRRSAEAGTPAAKPRHAPKPQLQRPASLQGSGSLTEKQPGKNQRVGLSFQTSAISSATASKCSAGICAPSSTR
ncbi:hypothetical protein HMPREF0731_2123, partial [Pseudoroseomonas cervicalis ATCC 49957]